MESLIQVETSSLTGSLETNKHYEFSPNWFFDEKNYSIYSDISLFNLTKREAVFFKMLVDNRVVTYEEMKEELWIGVEDLTKNAISLFVRNFRKKLPSKILNNFTGIGYKLMIYNESRIIRNKQILNHLGL